MKVVATGEDGGGKSQLLSALTKITEERLDCKTTISTHVPVCITIETNSNDPKYAKKFELWEDSKTYSNYSPLLLIMHRLVDIVLVCFPLDMMQQRPDDVFELLQYKVDETLGNFEFEKETYKCKLGGNPTVFLVGCRLDILNVDPKNLHMNRRANSEVE